MPTRRHPILTTIATGAAALGLGLGAGLGSTPAAGAADPPRYEAYYSIFERGEAAIPLLDTAYVPQGLAHLPELDAMAVSYYDDDGGPSVLVLLDRVTSAPIKTLTLDDSGHVGGLATSGDHLWVASTDRADSRLLRYDRADVVDAADGDELVRDAAYDVPVSSFVEVAGDDLHLGLFDRTDDGTLHRYALDDTDDPQPVGDPITIPPGSQGLTLAGDTAIFSHSYSRVDDSELTIGPDPGTTTRTIVAPNMAEDTAVADGELYVLYESGAQKFPDADYRVRTIHHGPLSELTA